MLASVGWPFSHCSSSGRGDRAEGPTRWPGPWKLSESSSHLLLVSPLFTALFSGNLHDTYPVPEVPEGGWAWHHQRGDHQRC